VQPFERGLIVRVDRFADIGLNVLQGGLQSVQRSEQFFQVSSGNDHLVRFQPVRRRQLTRDVSLLATALPAIDPAATGSCLFGQFPTAPPAPLLRRLFRHVTNSTHGELREQ